VKIGVFGGTFDPIHRGHLEPVAEARRQLELDVVYYLPTASPPHKQATPGASALARFAMVELALLDQEGCETCTWEMTPGRRAYTVETLERFREELPGAALHWLLGSDSLAQITNWRRWRDLLVLARLVVLRRPGWQPREVVALAPEVMAAYREGRITLVDNTAHDLSASRLRALLARGEDPPAGDIPPLVLDYVRKYKIYDEATGPL
jgi:nicotinate-nucleotide adenylyltransferase